jgi:single-stranded-DNA-specific exonuclease
MHLAAGPETVLGVTRSLSGRHWIWRRGEERVALGIAQRLALPELVGRLLAARGVSMEAAADYLTPTLRALLPDPSVLLDMDAAAERLAHAVKSRETVAVFGDYDVDGACGTALMVSFLRQLGCTVMHYVPDRLGEGYGPNAPALLALSERGATLVICVDCGTASGAALAVLAGRADVVVLDHHKAEGPPPRVLATVNPNRLDCGSGLTALCAAGVAFLTAVATQRCLRRDGFFAQRTAPDMLRLLDLVALATVCDVMPLTGINRALVAQGLKIMNLRERPGIAALLEVAQAKDHPTAMTCGFALGPRINAAGRIGAADMGLRLLLCDDPEAARALAIELDTINRQRQEVEASIIESAVSQAQAQIDAGHAALLITGADWHPGVVGIVAGRLKERHNRPVCVAGLAEGIAKGSGRSVLGLDLGATVIRARQEGILLTGGGHPMAAGFSLREADLPRFHAWLDERLGAAMTLPSAVDLAVEGMLTVPATNAALAAQVGRLAPFGNGNPEPVFALPRVRVVRADRVGRDGATVRSYVEGEGGGRLKALLFRAKEGPLAEALLRGDRAPIHLAGRLQAESWGGREEASLLISDGAPT